MRNKAGSQAHVLLLYVPERTLRHRQRLFHRITLFHILTYIRDPLMYRRSVKASFHIFDEDKKNSGFYIMTYRFWI